VGDFELLKFLSEIAKTLVGKEGVSPISILLFIGTVVYWYVKKYKTKKQEKLRKEQEARELAEKKIRGIKRMTEHGDKVDKVLERMLQKVAHNKVVRACVAQILNGTELMNGVGIFKILMTNEERLSVHIGSIKHRYKEVIINGRYDKLFKKLTFSTRCLLKIEEVENMNYEFAEDPDNYIYMYMLYTDLGQPMAVVMVTFEDIQYIGDEFLMSALYNHIMEIEKILKS
jgi:hypothetical protein